MEDFNPLDMMCEVVMEEGEDQSLPEGNSSSSNEDFSLPPIPMFDLQSNHFTYMPPVQPEPSPDEEDDIPASIISLPVGPVIKRPETKPPKLTVRSVEDLNDSKDQEKEKAALHARVYNKKRFNIVHEAPDQYPKNLGSTTADEIKYYGEIFADTKKVSLLRLHCTSCQKHVGTNANNIKSHRMLSVLSCSKCYEFYGDGVFPKDKTDNTEVYCRWCGQGGEQVCCSFCPKVFCYKCVRNNFGPDYLTRIEKVNDWACFCCAQTPLWPLRAICRALIYMVKNVPNFPVATCCLPRGRKPLPTKLPTLMPAPKTVQLTNVRAPMIVFNQQRPPILRPAAGPRARPPAIFPKPLPPSPRYLIRPQRQVAPTPRPVPTAPKQVPVTMPEVYVDHSAQDHMVVRLRMPQNREQYLRVNITGSCMRIPNLSPTGPPQTQALRHSFRLCKLVFNRLISIKQRGDKGSPIQEQMKDIRSTMGQLQQAVALLQTDMERNCAVVERQQQRNQQVINIDDEDETITWDFERKSRHLFLEDEDDVEIIDCDTPTIMSSNKNKRKQTFTVDSPSAAKKAKASHENGEIAMEEDPLAVDEDISHEPSIFKSLFIPSTHKDGSKPMTGDNDIENSKSTDDSPENSKNEAENSSTCENGSKTSESEHQVVDIGNTSHEPEVDASEENNSSKEVDPSEDNNSTKEVDPSQDNNSTKDVDPPEDNNSTKEVDPPEDNNTLTASEPDTTNNDPVGEAETPAVDASDPTPDDEVISQDADSASVETNGISEERTTEAISGEDENEIQGLEELSKVTDGKREDVGDAVSQGIVTDNDSMETEEITHFGDSAAASEDKVEKNGIDTCASNPLRNSEILVTESDDIDDKMCESLLDEFCAEAKESSQENMETSDLNENDEQLLLDEIDKETYDSMDNVSDDILRDAEIIAS